MNKHKHDYPTLRLALQILCNDQGLDSEAVQLEEVDFENERLNGPPDLDKIEVALASLTREELTTLCISEEDEWDVIFEKLKADGHDEETMQCVLESLFAAAWVEEYDDEEEEK